VVTQRLWGTLLSKLRVGITISAATGLRAAYLLGVLFSWGQAAERSLYSNPGILCSYLA